MLDVGYEGVEGGEGLEILLGGRVREALDWERCERFLRGISKGSFLGIAIGRLLLEMCNQDHQTPLLRSGIDSHYNSQLQSSKASSRLTYGPL